jgi:LysM repeat protein
VIDAARPTSAGDPPAAATSAVDGSPIIDNVSPELIIPVSVSTPNADGNIFHDVKFGQTLWQIAITYNVKIDDIKRLNNLFDNNIYPGSTLLIKQGMVVATASPTEGPTQVATSTGMPTLRSDARSATRPSTTDSMTQSAAADRSAMNVMIGIIVLALIVSGILTSLGASRKKNS